MGYYTRVFCKSETVPPFKELQEYMLGINSQYRLEGSSDNNSTNWNDFELHYKEGKLPILVELNRTDEGLGKEEIEEFIEEIGLPGFSIRKIKVIRYLNRTKYIICNQLPSSDIDEDGFIANEKFTKFFVDNYQGMFQADGEGFYDNNKIILELK